MPFRRKKGLSSDELFEQSFQLKMNSKQMEKQANKAFREMEKWKRKVASAIRAGDKDVAAVYAESAIRLNKQGLNLLNLAAKLDAVRSQLEASQRAETLTFDVKKMNATVSRALAAQNTTQIMAVMDKFSTQFEELGVKDAAITGALGSSTAGSYDYAQVDDLLKKVGEEHSLEVSSMLSSAPVSVRPQPQPQRAAAPPRAAGPVGLH